MTNTLAMSRQERVALAQRRLEAEVREDGWSMPEKLAFTCRILFDGGHDSGLAGQITGRRKGTNMDTGPHLVF
jgi:L-fuculose-phosphate aldolase